jgi:hypothetical protein
MSTILVVEPRKILQHATAIALFPEHEARMTTTIPEAEELKGFAAVIVDAAVLREINGLSAQAMRAIELWQTPTIWIDGEPPQAPNRDRLVIVKRPVSRKAMRDAVAMCLGQTTRLEDAAASAQPNIIDLVDVVEAAAAKPIRTMKKKKL